MLQQLKENVAPHKYTRLACIKTILLLGQNGIIVVVLPFEFCTLKIFYNLSNLFPKTGGVFPDVDGASIGGKCERGLAT